jgi:hypothetical protein
MIQLSRSDVKTSNTINLNLYDVTTATTYYPLISLTSQLTGKSKVFIPLAVATSTHTARYVGLLLEIFPTIGSENLLIGQIFLGSTDYPLGFYDVTIYQNSSSVNLNPSNAIKTIYKGLANLSATSAVAPVDYTEYTTNDSDTESVYTTF